MSEHRIPIVPFDNEHLTRRLQRAAGKFGAHQVAEREIHHLVAVVTRCSALLGDVYTDARLRTVLGDNPRRLAALVASPWFRLPWADDIDSALHRLGRLPGDVRAVGDQALFDVAVTGRSRVRGLPLDELGRKAYFLAADVLEILAEDARLREHFVSGGAGTTRLEDEVCFLRRCAERFDLYSRLIREAEEPEAPPEEPQRASLMPVVQNTARELVARPGPSRLFLGEDVKRERLLAAYERLLLFAAVDLEALRRDLAAEVVDQADAISTLIDDFSLFAVGTQNFTKPASYFLVGPTGVGKNHLIETLVRQLGREWNLEIPFLTIEGPNYTYPSDINELRGATRGFIRSDEPGLLSEFHERAEQAPLSVILVDEVEKAHPQLQRFFLSILDRGSVTDAHGRELHFEGTLVFFTSNIGYRERSHATHPIGFGGEAAAEAAYRSELAQELKRQLAPEFINRLKLVRFQHLPRSSVAKILDLEFEKVAMRYREVHGIQVVLSPAGKEWLLDQGYSHEYGARHLTAQIERHCNAEVGKMLRRDEIAGQRDPRALLAELRRAKDGESPVSLADLDGRIREQARARVEYLLVVIDAEAGKLIYRCEGRRSS